jgi:16S rRNA (guanine(966)-N(2))-methyltransferase RsmD
VRAGAQRNSVRIIGGQWRRSVLHFPDVPDLRPTPDRVRETLFNWLGQDLSGKTCLDLFAGSGALGFEAASRGAPAVTLVERDPRACEALLQNAQRLKASQLKVERVDALEFLARGSSLFDVVFLDPPFRLAVNPELLERIGKRLAAGGSVYLESNEAFEDAATWQAQKRGRAGKVHYQLLTPRSDDD